MAQQSLFDSQARTAFKPKAQFDAAKRTRRLATWQASSSGPRVVLSNLNIIRDRSRDSGRNDPYMAAATRHLVTDIVGTGILPRMTTKKAKLKATVTALWARHEKECDADGVLDFAGLEALVAQSVEEAGEILVRIRPRYLSDGLAVPVQYQLLEADMCPLQDFMAHPDLPIGHHVFQGVEMDPLGRRVARWIFKSHPGDGYTGQIDPLTLQRVPSSEIFSVYYVKRPGQLRGVPEGTSVLVKSRLVGDYDDAVVEKAKIQNLFVGVVTKESPANGTGNLDPLTGQSIEYDDDDTPLVPMQPGAMIEMRPGEIVSFSSPPATGVGYNDFMRQQNLSIAAGRGISYEILTGDLLNISDRSLRVGIQQYRRNVEQKQWLYYIPMFCQRIWNAFIDAAALAGLISLRDVEEAKQVEWVPQAWAYIHPTQDVQARVQEIAAGITSRSAAISRRGDDPEIVDQQRADDQERERRLGILPVASATPGGAPNAQPTPATTTKPTKKKGTTA